MDPRTPVLVGAAAVSSRLLRGDPPEAVELMALAAEAAAARTGAPGVRARVARVVGPRGTWGYRDPGALLRARLGCPGARSVVAELGMLQSGLLHAAAADLAAGRAGVVLVAGGEARDRAIRAARAGVEAPETVQAEGVAPDEVLAPTADVIHRLEVERRMVQAVEHYALIENATRAHDGMALGEHRAVVARLWAACNAAAADNPLAWNPAPMSAEALSVPSLANRPLAFPYLKWHVTQWNVDLASALLLTTVGTARSLGLDDAAWVFPVAGADSNHMVPLVARAEPWRCPGAGIAGRAALAAAGIGPDDLAAVDLYSCFPIAVRLQARELGLDDGRPLTVGGGMAFAGGPFNNAVLQATVRAAELLAGGSDANALVSAVSGMLTKQGMTVWSTTPPADGFRHLDVTAEVAVAVPERPVAADADHQGEGTVVTSTVRYQGMEPAEGIVLVDLDHGGRGIGVVADPAVAAAMTTDEWSGRRVRLVPGGAAAPA